VPVGRVGDVDVAGGIHRDVLGAVQFRYDGQAAIALVTGKAVSRDGGDVAIGGDFADGVIARVGNVHVEVGVDSHAHGQVQLRAGSRAPVAVSAGAAAG